MKRTLRVLHLTHDEKFFDSVFSEWEMNEDFKNEALFYTPRKNYKFKYIKRIEALEIYHRKKDVKKRLEREDYDVVFIHSMPYNFYQFVTWIPEKKIVIWWGWGFDIYESQAGLPPIVNIDMFKAKTRRYVNKKGYSAIKFWVTHFIGRNTAKSLQEAALKRINYYQPVIKLEMDLMRQNKFFKAKEFYYKHGEPILEEFVERVENGNIILGNSATPSNNHLDAVEVIQKLKQKNQKIIIPLSYGYKRYKAWLKPYLPGIDIQPIYDFMPFDKFFQIVDKCSYAVYGTIRQQAMGNISHAISKGIKVFLYKDSLAYQNHIALGFVVFAIEDMTEDSLKTPLTREQMEQNNKAIMAEYNRRMDVYHQAVKEMRETLYVR